MMNISYFKEVLADKKFREANGFDVLNVKTIEASMGYTSTTWQVRLVFKPESGLAAGYRTAGAMVTMNVTPFPGCCGISVIDHLNIPYAISKRGIGTYIVKALVATANLYITKNSGGNGRLLATTSDYQLNAVKILKKLRWHKLQQFRNPNSNRLITLWEKKLMDSEPKKISGSPKY